MKGIPIYTDHYERLKDGGKKGKEQQMNMLSNHFHIICILLMNHSMHLDMNPSIDLDVKNLMISRKDKYPLNFSKFCMVIHMINMS